MDAPPCHISSQAHHDFIHCRVKGSVPWSGKMEKVSAWGSWSWLTANLPHRWPVFGCICSCTAQGLPCKRGLVLKFYPLKGNRFHPCLQRKLDKEAELLRDLCHYVLCFWVWNFLETRFTPLFFCPNLHGCICTTEKSGSCSRDIALEFIGLQVARLSLKRKSIYDTLRPDATTQKNCVTAGQSSIKHACLSSLGNSTTLWLWRFSGCFLFSLTVLFNQEGIVGDFYQKPSGMEMRHTVDCCCWLDAVFPCHPAEFQHLNWLNVLIFCFLAK